jgi:uncharacterized protein YjbI with pentapeptide repeats
MNFYLKASDKAHQGFEFTHKSFGDYLTARALVNYAYGVAETSRQRGDIALQDFAKATSTGSITLEIVEFVRDEYRLRVTKAGSARSSVDVKNQLAKLASTVLEDGFPLIVLQDPNFRNLEKRHRNCESALWMLMSGAAHSVAETGEIESSSILVNWPDDRGLLDLINRLSAGGEVSAPILQCLECISAPGANLYGADLLRANFRWANLEGTNFVLANAITVDFRGANLRDCQFLAATLDDAKFAGADVEGADFVSAIISGTDLVSASTGSYRISEITLVQGDRVYETTYQEPTLEQLKRIQFNYSVGLEVSHERNDRLVRISQLREELSEQQDD